MSDIDKEVTDLKLAIDQRTDEIVPVGQWLSLFVHYVDGDQGHQLILGHSAKGKSFIKPELMKTVEE